MYIKLTFSNQRPYNDLLTLHGGASGGSGKESSPGEEQWEHKCFGFLYHCMYTNTEQDKIHLVMNNNSTNKSMKWICSLSHEYCTLTLHIQSILSTYCMLTCVTCKLYPDIQHPDNRLYTGLSLDIHHCTGRYTFQNCTHNGGPSTQSSLNLKMPKLTGSRVMPNLLAMASYTALMVIGIPIFRSNTCTNTH